MPHVTGRDEPWPFFHFWRHHFLPNWHHVYSTCAGGKDLSNDAKIRVVGLMEPQICTEMLKKLSEKRFLKTFLTVSKPSRRSITAAKRKEKEKKERRGKNLKIEKPKENFYFCARSSQNVVKRDHRMLMARRANCRVANVCLISADNQRPR